MAVGPLAEPLMDDQTLLNALAIRLWRLLSDLADRASRSAAD